MLDRGVEFYIRQNKGDWRWPFLKISDELQKADLLFGNLESIISDKGTKVGSIYSFRAEPESIEALTFAGFDVVSVANNLVKSSFLVLNLPVNFRKKSTIFGKSYYKL